MEFLVLNKPNTSQKLDFPYDSYAQFNLDDMEEAECIYCRTSFWEATNSRRGATDPSSNEV